MAKNLSVNSLDEKRLEKAATDLSKALKAKITGHPLKFKSGTKLEGTNTDGWHVVIATMGLGLPSLQIWLDRFNGGTERHFWVGFAASRLTIIGKALESFPNSPRKITYADLAKVKGVYSLKAPLTKSTAKNPIVQEYHNLNKFYFGFFDLAQKSGDQRLNIERVVDFFIPIIHNLLKVDLGHVEPAQHGFFKRLIRDRQTKFRNAILQAYNSACAVTGCDVEACLEATHLDRFADTYDNRITNGLLLRADLHRLMDASLMTFSWSKDGQTLTVKIDPSVKEKVYRDLDDAPVKLPNDPSCWPSKERIARHAANARSLQ